MQRSDFVRHPHDSSPSGSSARAGANALPSGVAWESARAALSMPAAEARRNSNRSAGSNKRGRREPAAEVDAGTTSPPSTKSRRRVQRSPAVLTAAEASQAVAHVAEAERAVKEAREQTRAAEEQLRVRKALAEKKIAEAVALCDTARSKALVLSERKEAAELAREQAQEAKGREAAAAAQLEQAKRSERAAIAAVTQLQAAARGHA